MAYRKWKETKVHPGTAGPGNRLGCSLVSFHFLFAILCPQAVFIIVSNLADILAAHSAGKIGSLITVESGHSIGTSLAVLRMFHRLGARSLTLTHNCNTPW